MAVVLVVEDDKALSIQNVSIGRRWVFMKKSKIATIFLCLGFLLTGCGGNSGSTDTGAVVKPDHPSP